jgi:CO/xanthine dehydrogenase FAD-binding subunit
VTGDGDGASSARVVLGGVGHLPLVVEGLDDLGGAGAEDVVLTAGEAAAAVDAPADIHGTKDYRSHLARKLTERAVRRALAQRS